MFWVQATARASKHGETKVQSRFFTGDDLDSFPKIAAVRQDGTLYRK